MKKNLVQPCLGLLGLMAVAMTSQAGTIYSNLTPTGGWTVPSLNGEIGNEVTVSGANWQVTGLDIEIYSQGGIFPNGRPGNAHFQAQLYANNGTGGQPGTLLWQSAVEPIYYLGGLSLLHFSVPDVVVPDTFTWTLEYSNPLPLAPGLPSGTGPTIGTSNVCWTRGEGDASWTQVTAAGNLMAEITAVPEPATYALLTAGVLTPGLRRAFKKKNPGRALAHPGLTGRI